jgi:hypothetical protein
MSATTIYCVKCRESVTPTNPTVGNISWKQGKKSRREGTRRALQGTCPKCGKAVAKFISNEKKEEEAKEPKSEPQPQPQPQQQPQP